MPHVSFSALVLVLCCLLDSARVHAREPTPEPLDTTRLDVERLPPEAIEPDRKLYHLGWHVRAELGGQGFAGGVGRIASIGPVAHLAVGYELTQWLLVAADFGLGM